MLALGAQGHMAWHYLCLGAQRTSFTALTILIGALVLCAAPGWAQQPQPGGTLRLAMPGDMTFFNANQGPAPGYFTFWVWNNIFNSLLTMTPPPEWKVVPELATAWEVQDGGRTWVFHLAQGVTFHDGTAFDAQAAKWNFDRILDRRCMPGCARTIRPLTGSKPSIRIRCACT